MQQTTAQSPRYPALPALLVVVATLGVIWYLAQVLGGLNGDVVTFQRYFDRFTAFGYLPQEYPPAALLVFAFASFPHLAWPVPAFAAWMAIPVLAGYVATWRQRGPGAAFAYLALLAVGAIATVLTRYDILPALLTVAALWAAQRSHWTVAYVLLVAGALLKLYPLALLPVFLLAQRREAGAIAPLARSATPAVMLLLAGVALPWLVWGSGSIGFITGFAIQRPAELESTPAVLAWALAGGRTRLDYGQVGFVGPAVGFTTATCTVLLAAIYAGVLFQVGRGRMALGRAALVTVGAIIVLNKVFSAQYLVWLIPLVASEEGLTVGWLAVAALTTLCYPLLWLRAPAAGLPLMVALLARDLLLLWLVLERAGVRPLVDLVGRWAASRRLRRLLLVGAAALFLEVMAGEAAALVLTALGPLHTPDFIAYYTAAKIVVAGRGPQLYDLATQTAMQASLTAGWGGQRFLLAWANPPQDALLVAPLAYLPYRAAYVVWLLIQLGALLAAVALLVRAEGMTGRVAWLAGAGAMAAFPVFITLLQGQADGLCLLGLAILRADWRRPTWRSALAVVLLLLKPHLVAVVLLLMLARRTSALALLAGGAASGLAAAVAFGPEVWLRWPSLVVPTASGAAEGWVTGHEDRLALGGQLEALGLPSVPVAILLLVAMLLVAAILAKRTNPLPGFAGTPPPSGGERPAALAVAVVASILLSPHLNGHDFVLLLLPGVFVLGRLLEEPSLARGLALAAATLAVDALLLVSGGVVIAGVAALGWAAWPRRAPALVATVQGRAAGFVSETLDRSCSGS
jgi:Glycosyltransferase family 87